MNENVNAVDWKAIWNESGELAPDLILITRDGDDSADEMKFPVCVNPDHAQRVGLGSLLSCQTKLQEHYKGKFYVSFFLEDGEMKLHMKLNETKIDQARQQEITDAWKNFVSALSSTISPQAILEIQEMKERYCTFKIIKIVPLLPVFGLIQKIEQSINGDDDVSKLFSISFDFKGDGDYGTIKLKESENAE